MKNKEITVRAADCDGDTIYERDGFETIKEARAWVKDAFLHRSYWSKLAENDAFADDIDTIQLLVNGEIHSDWFPEFKAI